MKTMNTQHMKTVNVSKYSIAHYPVQFIDSDPATNTHACSWTDRQVFRIVHTSNAEEENDIAYWS